MTAGKISLICKGAESELLSLISGDGVQETYRQIDKYAVQGLRTLVVAQKEMTREEYQDAAKKLDAAHRQVNDRKDAMIKAQISVEQNLQLLGATAVEDKLQDGVAETIRDLKKAGIKIWVLTGDKLETAVSVATSCGLIESEGMERMILARQPNADSCGEVIGRYVTALELDDPTNSADTKPKYLIVDGRSLHLAMKHHLEKFKRLCSKCAVVVCCRMSPIQKAEVVRMVKLSRESPVTAAIGDGANDVSMIQEAHVGFGLMGREGRQAVNAADFAFGRFRFLKPVLLVHGSLFYHRVSNLIHFFFYKNVIFVTPQVIFSFYNVFATQTLYHGILVSDIVRRSSLTAFSCSSCCTTCCSHRRQFSASELENSICLRASFSTSQSFTSNDTRLLLPHSLFSRSTERSHAIGACECPSFCPGSRMVQFTASSPSISSSCSGPQVSLSPGSMLDFSPSDSASFMQS